MGGGDAPDPPQPSEEEKALQKEQTEILRQQRDIITAQVKQQELLAPHLYKDLGLKPKMDASGKIIGFEEEIDPLSDMRKEIEKGFLERTQKALKGELDVDPALTRELGEGEKTLRETLARNLGPGYETSTPGIEALANFQKRATELRDAARRGDLSLNEQLSQARTESNQIRSMRQLQGVTGVSALQTGGADALSRTAQGFNMPIGQMFQQRQMQFQAGMANAQIGAQNMATIGGGVGAAAGMAGMIFF